MQAEGTQKIPVKYIRSGIGDFVEDTIYLHEKLKRPEWKTLRDKILEHEKAHKVGPYGVQDWVNDSKKASYDLDVIYFMASTPSAWAQLSPIRTYGRGKLYFDRQLLLTYVTIVLVFVLAWNLL
jgi:hypothetical protein